MNTLMCCKNRHGHFWTKLYTKIWTIRSTHSCMVSARVWVCVWGCAWVCHKFSTKYLLEAWSCDELIFEMSDPVGFGGVSEDGEPHEQRGDSHWECLEIDESSAATIEMDLVISENRISDNIDLVKLAQLRIWIDIPIRFHFKLAVWEGRGTWRPNSEAVCLF